MTLYDIMCQLTLQLYWTCMDPKRGFFCVCVCVFFFLGGRRGVERLKRKFLWEKSLISRCLICERDMTRTIDLIIETKEQTSKLICFTEQKAQTYLRMSIISLPLHIESGHFCSSLCV